jgi:uncharacterized protein YsxB (DUF464 family)
LVKAGEVYVAGVFRGHAGFAKKGEDIVCAAVSVLVINTINAIQALTDDKIDLHTDEKTGEIRFSFIGTPSDKATLLMATLDLGLTGIYEEYSGKYLKIEYAERDGGYPN